ncbi:hypothetical protein B0G71_7551 [Paraburkholderia sp. BL27I4N3]|nr:hypothetical protein B0G71_7551 [Paraburkholderia sp. BL27I4N3]
MSVGWDEGAMTYHRILHDNRSTFGAPDDEATSTIQTEDAVAPVKSN